MEHVAACWWITIAIILHNLVIDAEGDDVAEHFTNVHQQGQELNDHGAVDEPLFDGDDDVPNIDSLLLCSWHIKQCETNYIELQ